MDLQWLATSKNTDFQLLTLMNMLGLREEIGENGLCPSPQQNFTSFVNNENSKRKQKNIRRQRTRLAKVLKSSLYETYTVLSNRAQRGKIDESDLSIAFFSRPSVTPPSSSPSWKPYVSITR